MREWRDIHSQILAILEEQGYWKSEVGPAVVPEGRDYGAASMREAEIERGKAEGRSDGGRLPTSPFDKIHRSVLSGFLSNIALRKEKNIFRAAKGREVMIFPGSGLFGKAGNWIVAAEVVETSRVFARTVANIDSAWLEDLGKDLCKYTYLNPHWEKNRGEVVASEQVSLFGLIIVPERKVSYGKVNPDEASDIFIQNALMDGDVKKPFAFMKHNLQLIEDIRDLQNRLRRRDLLIGEPELFDFYKQRLPAVYDTRTLSKLLKRKGNDRFLRMRREDLILYNPDEAEIAQFPDRLEFAGHPFNCVYSFEPGAEDDGVTVKIPATLAPAVSPQAVDWLVPGLIPEKIEGLIKGLPKAYRKKLVPVKDTVAIICREMAQVESSLISALGEFIYSRFGVDIPAAAWSDKILPDHLKMRIAITTPDGRQLRVGRDASILRQQMDGTVESDEFKLLQRKWEKSGITVWDFGDLPDFIGAADKPQPKWVAYPALEKEETADKRVNLRLFQQREKALASHRQGVMTLYAIHFSKDLKFLKRQLKIPADKSHLADYFGGAKKLEQRLYQHHVQTLFGKNIRSKNDFYAHAAKAGPQILAGGRQLLESTLAVLAAYWEARSLIFKIQSGYGGNANAVKFFEELINGLVSLVPENFFEIYDQNQFTHLERYIKAALIRAQRAPVDFEKDQAKANEIRKFADGLNGLLKALTPTVSAEKRQAIEDYFWLLEEYKVSVFAQELKTAIPVSAKRLAEKLGQIERMV
jgi:ATP-dependent helicase HrpA